MEIPVKILVFGEHKILVSGHINGDLYFWGNMFRVDSGVELVSQKINIHKSKILGLFMFNRFKFVSASKEGLIILWEV
jgi:hypothetical protein